MRPTSGTLFLVLSLVIGACGDQRPTGEAEAEGEGSPAAGCAESFSDDAADLFSYDALPRFEVRDVDQDALAQVCSAQSASNDPDTYVRGNFFFGDEGPLAVGLRCRGTRGEGVHPGYKISFDEYVGGQDFLGLKRLNLDGAAGDPAVMREPLFYRLACAAGLPAPRAGHALLSIDGAPPTLHVNVERIDVPFLQARDHRWRNTAGFLYKVEAGADFAACGDCDAEIARIDAGGTYEPQTHSDEPHPDLVRLLDLANAGEATFAAEIGAILDVTQWLRVIALEQALSDPAGLAQGSANFKLYRPDQRFLLIPYDRDDALAAAPLADLRAAVNPLARRLIATFAGDYDAALAHVADAALDVARVQGAIDAIAAHIGPAVAADATFPESHDLGAGAAALKGIVADRAAELAAARGAP